MIELRLGKKLAGADGPLQLAIDTTIAAHELCAIFGNSGAGKTTLLRMLAGLCDPDSGRIVVDGVTWFDSARKINLPARKRSIGFVFQDYALFPNMTVEQNVAYAVTKEQSGWVAELLALTGLTQLAGRALARKPALLLLDEPLSALDLSLRSELQNQLELLHHRCGLTTLLVSHDIGEVFRLAQRVIVLEQGGIKQSGTPSEIFLQQKVAGKISLRGQLLAIRKEE
jgi:molybdate transport system ATP-binding protein